MSTVPQQQTQTQSNAAVVSSTNNHTTDVVTNGHDNHSGSPATVASSAAPAPRASAPPSTAAAALLPHRTAAAVIGERRAKQPIGLLRARIAELQRQLARAERAEQEEREHDAKSSAPSGAGDDDDDLEEDDSDVNDHHSEDRLYNAPHVLLDVYDRDDRSMQSRRDEVALGRAAHTTASPSRTPMHSATSAVSTPTLLPPMASLSTPHNDNGNGTSGPSRRLLIVTNRLPVSLVKKRKTKKEQKGDSGAASEEEEWHFTKSSGGLVSALNGVKGIDMTWIGWPGEEIKKPEDQKEISTRLLKEQNCVPVFLPKTMCELYYSGFANGLLWPLFHYMQPAIELIQGAGDQFTAYQQANQAFCDIVLQHYQDGDLIWVHDYHLFLLPALLRAALPNAKIGFFLHIPFPSSELYQTLPWREQLLQGLLSSDLVGFHTHDYARHFFISCTRILGLQCTSEGVEMANGFSAVGTFPIGIDAARFKAALRTQSVRDHTKELRKQFSGLRVILGIDRLDYTKGIPHKLFAMERFLQNNPEWIGKVVLVQIAVPSRGDVPEYQRLSKKVHQLVGRINGRFGTLTHVPIHLLDTSIGFDRMCALYRISDCCVVSSIRDGMNLVSYEYISCQSERQPGVLILSESTGAAQSLGAGAISVNPWDTDQLAAAILKALTMKEEERREHYRWCYHHVNKHTAQYWADSFVSSLISTNTPATDRGPRTIPQSLRAPRVAHAFHASRHRMIVSGLVGTLSHKRLKGMAKDATGPLFAMASNRVRTMVNELAKDSHTTFLLVTARGRPMCDRIMGRTQAWIAAENGYFLRRGPDAEWETPFDNVDISWIPEVRTKFEYFTQRTPKSFIEERTSYLSWHYHDCDQYFGEKQARELLLNLMSGPLANASMQVFHHARIVQVRPIGVSKAFLVDRLMAELEAKRGPIDLALCMGNFPPMDEDVFGACQQRVIPSPANTTTNSSHVSTGLTPLLPTRSISTPQSNGTMISSSTAVAPGTPPLNPSSSSGLVASELPLSAATPPLAALNPAKIVTAQSMPPLLPLDIPPHPSPSAAAESKLSLASPSSPSRMTTIPPYASAMTPAAALSIVSPSVTRTVFTIAVGRKHSRAAYYLDGMRAVEKLLESLVDALPSQIHSPVSTPGSGSGISVRGLALPPPSAVPGTQHALIAASMNLGSPQPLSMSSPMSSHATTMTHADGTTTTTGAGGRPLLSAALFTKPRSSSNATDDDDDDHHHDDSGKTATPSSAAVQGSAVSPRSATVNVTTGLRLLQSSMSLPDFNGVNNYGETI